MDNPFAFAIKEEVLANILKTHNNILVIGRHGSGKTVTAIKAAGRLGSVTYYGADLKAAQTLLEPFTSFTTLLNSIAEAAGSAVDSIFIMDEPHKMDEESRLTADKFLASEKRPQKIVLIVNVALEAKELMRHMDVVVRFKDDTAEMIISNLRDIHKV